MSLSPKGVPGLGGSIAVPTIAETDRVALLSLLVEKGIPRLER